MSKDNFLLIQKDVLPEIYEKVLLAKNLIESGEVKSTSEAAQRAGISRSVFYKYKDSVFSYNKKESSGILSIQIVLLDKPGILVNLLKEFYEASANILTVNQGIPIRGRAFVSLSADISSMKIEANELLSSIKNLKGVVNISSL